MRALIEFPLKDGGSVVIEVDEVGGYAVPAAGPDDLPEKASQTFETALACLRPVSESLLAQLRSLVNAPDEIGVEFGLKMSTKAGVVVASAAAEANFKVRLQWKADGS